jgi:hypothetical protein
MTTPNSLLAAKAPEPPEEPRAPISLWRRVQAVVFILFCLEMGIVLVLFPWSSMWDRNYFFTLAPRWAALFASSYVRGAVSGIGLVNVAIAVSEAWRLRGA